MEKAKIILDFFQEKLTRWADTKHLGDADILYVDASDICRRHSSLEYNHVLKYQHLFLAKPTTHTVIINNCPRDVDWETFMNPITLGVHLKNKYQEPFLIRPTFVFLTLYRPALVGASMMGRFEICSLAEIVERGFLANGIMGDPIKLSDANSAYVLKIGDRFFSAYKNKRVQTAWCLAGAKLFRTGETSRLEKAESILTSKRKKFERIKVFIQ